MSKRLLFSIVLSFCCLLALSQTTLPKQALPNEKNNNWKVTGWVQADSGIINALRDTSFRPRFIGTQIVWPHPNKDTTTWIWTGQRWQRNASGAGGDTTIINHQITNYFDSVFNITNLGDTTIINNYLNTFIDSIFNITNLGDTTITVNNYLTQFIDSVITANAYQTWEGALIEGSDLTRSFNSHIGNNKFAFYSSTNHTASNTTVGALIAPQYNSLIVAPKLHVNLLRGGATITIPQNAYPFQRWRANGYDVFLTLNYNKANGATDGTTNFPTAAQLPQFRGDFRAFLHNFVKGYVDKVALENEENNFVTRPNWNVKDYLAEAGAAIQIFHDSIPNGIITNGGLTGQYFNQWDWRWLKAHGRDADADSLAKYKFPASQIPNLANWATIPQFSAGVAKMDSLIAGYATLNWDFVNFHYYEPIIDTTLQTTNTDVFGFMKEALENATGKLAISNEVGQHNSSPLIPVQLLQKAADVGMRYFIWYSADAADGSGAVALQDSSTLLRPNGVAFAALVPSLAPTDTSSKETFSIQQQQIFLQRLKKNYRQQLFVDTAGRVYADTTANGAGAGIYFPPADTVHVTSRIDSFTLANAINHSVTLVVHNGSVLRKIGTGIPAPNEVLINSATGGFKLGAYADAGAYIDIVYAPIGTSSGGGGSTSSTLEDVLNNGHVLNDAHMIANEGGLDIISGDTTFTTGNGSEMVINQSSIVAGVFDNVGNAGSNVGLLNNELGLLAYNTSTNNSRAINIHPTDISVVKNISGVTTTYNLPLTVNNISAGTDNNITLNYLQPSDTTGKWQLREDQRLSTNNSPNFAGLTSNGIIKLLGQLNTPAAPALATQNMYADSTGAWTIQGSNGFALSLSKNRLTANHRVFVQNKDYTLADSATVATNAANIASNTTAIAGKLTASNNLSDLTNAGTARTNLGLGTLATQNGTASNYVDKTISNTYTLGATQIFGASAANAGLRLSGVTANPSSLNTGDMWYRSDESKFRYYDGTTVRAFVTEQLIQTLTNKTISGTNNTLTDINATNINTGTLPTAQTPALTGDVTKSAGSATTTLGNQYKNDFDLNIYQALGSAVVAEPFPINRITNATGLATGQARFIPVWLPTATTLTGVKWYQGITGSYTANNYNGVGLYTYSGGTLTLVASSTNDGTIWTQTANTWGSKAFSSTYSASAGMYYILLLYSSSAQTTAPAIGATANFTNLSVSAFDFTNSAKLFPVVSGQTALPSTIAMSAMTGSANIFYAAIY